VLVGFDYAQDYYLQWRYGPNAPKGKSFAGSG
jgi:hypothetical protein